MSEISKIDQNFVVKKIDSEKISRPYVLNNDMFIVRDNAIIKLN